jgi:hypothetical protein
MEQLDFFMQLEEIKKPICPVCGITFERNRFNLHQIYCNKNCRIKEWGPKHIKNILKIKVKKCNKCKQELAIDNFNICDKYGNRRGKCKNCNIEHIHTSKGNLESYKNEKEYREEIHILQKQNKRRCRVCREIKELDYFPTDSSKKVFYNKKSYCKECAMKKYIAPYQNSPRGKEIKAKSDKKYFSKLESKQKINKRVNQKYHNDPQFRILCTLRNRVNKALDHKTKKAYKTNELLGCDIDELEIHLEKQFKEGMTWENYGRSTWHIDHIIPCASFDLTDPEQQKKCFHYTNLQPLWAKENMSKGAKIL